ncbi:MAG: hypothetical protein AABY64_10585 [Bdellovibrionota bacterium]
MKFTDRQQKWALTTGLLIALGFNLSVHFSPKSGPDYAQLGATEQQLEPVMLAKGPKIEGVTQLSSATPKDVKQTEASAGTTSSKQVALKRDGEYIDVSVQSSSDGKTKITYAACKAVQSNQCPTGNCVQNVALLDVNFNSSLAELANAFDAAGFSKCTPQAEAPVVAAKNAEVQPVAAVVATPAAVVAKVEETNHKEDFDKLKLTCDKKTKTDRLECNIDGLTKLLKNTKITYEKSDVTEFFDKQIKTALKNELNSSTADYSVWPSSGLTDYREKLTSLSEKIKEMQEEVREEYSYIRERVASVSIRAIAEKATEINNYHHSSAIDAPYAENAALNQLQLMTSILPTANRSGLVAAVNNSLIDSRYASNIYNSVGNYSNGILNRIADIGSMDPRRADMLLNTGLLDLDSWNYRTSAINSLGLRNGRGIRQGLDDLNYDRYDRGFFSDSRYSNGRGLRRQGLRGIQGGGSGLFTTANRGGQTSYFGGRRSLLGNDRYNDGFFNDRPSILTNDGFFPQINATQFGGRGLRSRGL